MPAQTPGTTGLMTLATCVVVVAALSIARDVLIPITLAVLLSLLLAPLVDLLRRFRLGRIPAVLFAVLLAFGVILGLGGVIGAQVGGLAGEMSRYAGAVLDKVQSLQSVTVSRLSGLINRVAQQADQSGSVPVEIGKTVAGTPDGQAASTGPATAANAPPSPIPVEVHQPTLSPAEMAQRILTPVLSPLATTGIVFVVAIFILLQREDLRDRLIRLLGAGDLHRTMMAMDEAGYRLSRYFLTQVALNTAFGCLIGVGLFLIGVPNPFLWGIIAALMRFVPYVGAFVSASLPLALAAAVDPGWSMVAWTAALFVAGETVMGQVVEPLVYGHSTGLSPVSVVVAAIFWGWLWGPIGLILSMPLTLCLVVLGRHVGRLEFLDVIFGDQPALTPVESFYQGMLAGNSDEVQDTAEQLLKDRALSSYYDEVAIPGLQLAAFDIERGVLTDDQIARIGSGVKDLVAELSDYADSDPVAQTGSNAAGPSRERLELVKRGALPPAWCAPSAVLCVAGRGPLDALAAAMLAQLLGKHGLGARQVPHAVVGSRAALASLDVAGVMMVCVCYASTNGTASHLRYTVRRLRTRLPEAGILVSLWPAEVMGDDRLRAAVAADGYAASLREATARCLERARRSEN